MKSEGYQIPAVTGTRNIEVEYEGGREITVVLLIVEMEGQLCELEGLDKIGCEGAGAGFLVANVPPTTPPTRAARRMIATMTIMIMPFVVR